MPYQFKPGSKILRRHAVKETTGLSDSSLDRAVRDGSFPKPVQLGARAVGWLSDEIEAWLVARVEASRGPKSDNDR